MKPLKAGLLSAMLVGAIAAPASASPTLTTNETYAAANLDLDGEGTASTHIVKVADIAIGTTNSSGLTLYISSGSIVKTSAQDITFQVVTVPDNAPAPSGGDFTTPSGSNYTYVTNAAGNENRDLYIRYTPASLQDAGNYDGLVNVWVVDK